jgi:spoIIIJ-associated protein
VTENLGNQRPEASEGPLRAVVDFCRKLVSRLRLDLVLEEKEENGIIVINLTGQDRPYLLSNSASLLNSMEYLLNKVFRLGKDDTPGIQLDSDNYRQHREAELVLLARMASQKVVTLRKPLSLQPMVPRERRIVHLALAGIEGVRSQSNGEGDNRSITIYPS